MRARKRRAYEQTETRGTPPRGARGGDGTQRERRERGGTRRNEKGTPRAPDPAPAIGPIHSSAPAILLSVAASGRSSCHSPHPYMSRIRVSNGNMSYQPACADDEDAMEYWRLDTAGMHLAALRQNGQTRAQQVGNGARVSCWVSWRDSRSSGARRHKKVFTHVTPLERAHRELSAGIRATSRAQRTAVQRPAESGALGGVRLSLIHI